jgi:hypothetical protein
MAFLRCIKSSRPKPPRRGKRAIDVETAWDGPRECCVNALAFAAISLGEMTGA